MKKHSENIRLYKNNLTSQGIIIKVVKDLKEKIRLPHRDNHYILLFQRKGSLTIETDFKKFTVTGAAIAFITPGQVHSLIKKGEQEIYFIFMEPRLIDKHYRSLLNSYGNLLSYTNIDRNNYIFDLLLILEKHSLAESGKLKTAITNSLISALTGIFLTRFKDAKISGTVKSPFKISITENFKEAVGTHFKELKKVKEYATLLNISPLYLNEAVKESTGFTASFWIYNEIITEAKRLLLYTEMDVKQIANELGFDDYAYFSRFFKQNTGATATAFRSETLNNPMITINL